MKNISLIQNLTPVADRLPEPEQIVSTSKRTNVSSYEPSDTKRGLGSKAELEHPNRFLKNISLAKFWLEGARFSLIQVNDFILRVRKIAIKMQDEACNHKARKQAAKGVRKLFGKIQETINTQEARRDTSAGNRITTPHSRKENGREGDPGNIENIELEIEPGLNMRINLVSSNFLTNPLKTLGEDFDLNPGIDPNTPLSDLNRGRGINLGSIRAIDNNANLSWDINLHHTTTIGGVIDAINSCGIAGLSADISPSKKGLKLTYAELEKSNLGQEFTISEAGGTTTKDLGILGNLLGHPASHPGILEGRDLDPILTRNTPISLLNRGDGLTLGIIKIALGETQKIIDLGSASTIGDVIQSINNSMPGVICSVNYSQKGITVESAVVGKSLVISDGDDKKSARGLGISGSPDIGGVLLFLIEALYNDDSEAISKSLEILDLSSEEIFSLRSETEAKLKRLEDIGSRIRGFQSDVTRLLSGVRGVDLFQASTDLAEQQSIYQSALQRGAAMIQPTLLDFIR